MFILRSTMASGYQISALIWMSYFFSSLNAVTIDCQRPDVVNENHISYCCKHPEGHMDVTDKCANETGFELQDRNKESLVDLTVKGVIAGTCFGVCVFGEWKFMKDGKLDMEAVKTHLASKYSNDPEYIKEITNAFDQCHSKFETKLADFMSHKFLEQNIKEFCDPLPSIILACVIKQFFHNCPVTHWTNTEECETIREFSQKCKDQLTIM